MKRLTAVLLLAVALVMTLTGCEATTVTVLPSTTTTTSVTIPATTTETTLIASSTTTVPPVTVYVTQPPVTVVQTLSVVTTAPVSTPTVVATTPTSLTNANQIQQFLTTNFSTCQTSIGPANFTFTVDKNGTILMPYDYWIQENYDATFFYNLKYSNQITTAQNNQVCGELKDFQQKMANALIAASPNTKFYGCYYSFYYDYPTIKAGMHASYYDSWVNYSPGSILTSYKDAIIGSFSWYPLTDGSLTR